MTLYRIEDQDGRLSERERIAMGILDFPCPYERKFFKNGHNYYSLKDDMKNPEGSAIRFFFKSKKDADFYMSGEAWDRVSFLYDEDDEIPEQEKILIKCNLNDNPLSEIVYEDDVQVAVLFRERPIMELICG